MGSSGCASRAHSQPRGTWCRLSKGLAAPETDTTEIEAHTAWNAQENRMMAVENAEEVVIKPSCMRAFHKLGDWLYLVSFTSRMLSSDFGCLGEATFPHSKQQLRPGATPAYLVHVLENPTRLLLSVWFQNPPGCNLDPWIRLTPTTPSPVTSGVNLLIQFRTLRIHCVPSSFVASVPKYKFNILGEMLVRIDRST